MTYKIVHVTEPFSGGVFDFLVNITTHTPEFKHIIIHGLREDEKENYHLFSNNVEFVSWKSVQREIDLKKDFLALKELVNILKNLDFDILHLHSSKAGFLGRLAARILKKQNRVVYTPHGVSFLRKDISNFKRQFFVFLEKTANKMGGVVVACSESEAEEFKKIGIKAKYVSNGIDCSYKNAGKNQINVKKITIGTVGRIVYQKNPKLFNEIAKFFKDIEFVWIGDGDLRNELTSSNIKVTGWMKKEFMEKELKNFDIYLSTSLWEGLPLSVLEAMCFQKPLILSNCVGNIDLVSNEYNGFIYNSKDEAVSIIRDLIKDKEKLLKMGENSFYILKSNFSVKKMIEGYTEIYKKIMENINE